uniref:Uncharacterized protein n=1 Tax=Timema tahoe TaxID=61484 RepID=A0A7R9IBI2_9NEOP|nr:unnamed protein product [Timema tahoe]
MLPVGYVACCEIQWDNTPHLLHLHIPESGPQSLFLCVTDTVNFYTAAINSDEIQSIASKLDTTIRATVDCFKQCFGEGQMDINEKENLVVLTLKQLTKEVKLPIRLQKIDSSERKVDTLKLILFQLSKAVKKKDISLHGDTNKPVEGLNSSPLKESQMYMPRIGRQIQSKRRADGMSIVNPGSKRYLSKPGVQFDD